MTEAAAKEQLREIAADLDAIRSRLLGVQSSLPAPAETGEEQDDEVTLSAIIQCILGDSLDPAIQDLGKAAIAQPDPDTTWESPMFENLGQALVLLRGLRGLSQAKAARAAGIGKSQLSKYENCKELPKLESLEKVLKVLKVGYFEFFYTLRFVDQRAASVGPKPQILPLPGEASPAIFTEALDSLLHPETQAVFQRVFAEFFKLYARVVEQVLVSRLDKKSPDGGRQFLGVIPEDDSEEAFE